MRDYYSVFIKGREYCGRKTITNIECEKLIEALAGKNNLTFMETWYYGNAIKYMFRLKNKGGEIENIDKAIDNLVKLRGEILEKRNINES